MAIRIFVGYDPREAAAYHVFCQSVIEHSSVPVAFYPLHKEMLSDFDGQRDGTNAFIFSRYLVPYLCNFEGYALFLDGDMVCTRDIAELMQETGKAVEVVHHDYKTKFSRKYIGSSLENSNIDYPRKNWSSVILWNCGHQDNKVLTPEFVTSSTGQYLHRFSWLQDNQIGELPSDWNYLVGEFPPGPASIYHYTLGVPGLRYYADTHASWNWHKTLLTALVCAKESPSEMVKRAEDRIGAI